MINNLVDIDWNAVAVTATLLWLAVLIGFVAFHIHLSTVVDRETRQQFAKVLGPTRAWMRSWARGVQGSFPAASAVMPLVNRPVLSVAAVADVKPEPRHRLLPDDTQWIRTDELNAVLAEQEV